MENSLETPQKTESKTTYDLAFPLLGKYPKKIKTLLQKGAWTPMFIAALFTIASIWKQPRCPSTDEWIKMWYIYTVEYYWAIKKNEKLPFATT